MCKSGKVSGFFFLGASVRLIYFALISVVGLLSIQVLADEPPVKPKTPEQIIPLAKQYCGSCHKLPSPSILPKASWPRVIDTMAEIAKDTTGQEFIPPEYLTDIKALYYGSAPQELPKLPYIDQPSDHVAFSGGVIGENTRVPLILNIQAVDLKLGAKREFLISDGELGRLTRLYEDDSGWHEDVIAELPIPIQARVVDFTGNGLMDVVVADLGVFPPEGVFAGKIHLLRQIKPGEFIRTELFGGLGRVADVQVLDLSGDGELDLAVAVFGGGEVGEVFWAEYQSKGKYHKHKLLPLNGALNITPVDLNNDGKMDLVSLVAQEHELLVAFINQGEGRFERMDLFQGPHPMFGFTNLTVVDLDKDGDSDLVFANGDAFDTQLDPKPYHGIQWLENLGGLKFRYHDIGRLYGPAKIAAGDINGDGDLDLVVSSWVNDWDDPKRQSLVWFENNGKQQFTARPLVGGVRGLVAIELADMTNDGRLDILAGAFRMDLLSHVLDDANGEAGIDNKDNKHAAEGKEKLAKNDAEDEIEAAQDKNKEPEPGSNPRLLFFENILVPSAATNP